MPYERENQNHHGLRPHPGIQDKQGIMNACIELSKIVPVQEVGKVEGICRITGSKSKGLLFQKWVKKTFTDWHNLHEGNIISNEALFCFDEASLLLQKKTGKDKPQRFRTYSHIVTDDGMWFALTKADKQKIVDLILSGKVKILCLTDSGQKHIFFKHRIGFWQLDELHIEPDIQDFTYLHGTMMEMLALGFGQEQIKTGNYYQAQILKAGIDVWQAIEDKLSPRRGEPIFDLAAWLMFTIKTSENDA